MNTYTRPADIENESMRIISAELKEMGIGIPEKYGAVVKRVIHATADFEFARTLTFVCGKSPESAGRPGDGTGSNSYVGSAYGTESAGRPGDGTGSNSYVRSASDTESVGQPGGSAQPEALRRAEGQNGQTDPVTAAENAFLHGTTIITDTNMALSGISKPSLQKLGCEAFCFMADQRIAAAAKENGTTRAVAAMEYAAERYPGAVYAVGNAPTALFKLSELMDHGLRPALVVAVPVGFVNVVEGKEEILRTCRKYEIPAIAALGRKGGSTVAAAILNALLYGAAGMLAPASRGW